MRKLVLGISGVLVCIAILCPLRSLIAQTQGQNWRNQMRDLMRTKLANSKNVLEGLVTEDYALVERSASEMRKMSEHSRWPQSDDEVYTHFNKEFRVQCAKLMMHAKNRDQDSTYHTFLRITSTCVNCHNHVRGSLRVTHDSTTPDSPVRLIPSDWEDGKVRRLNSE